MSGNKFRKISTFIFTVSTFLSAVSCAKQNYQDQLFSTGKTEALSCELQLPNSKYCVDLIWETMQTEEEMGSFFLKFYLKSDVSHYAEPGHSPYAQLFMPSMGHGSSPVSVEHVSDGVYRITNVYFSMPGEWDIRIQLKDGAKVVDQIIQKHMF